MKKKFHLKELIINISKIPLGIRIIVYGAAYLILGITVAYETKSSDAMPLYPLPIFIAADLIISTFINYYY